MYRVIIIVYNFFCSLSSLNLVLLFLLYSTNVFIDEYHCFFVYFLEQRSINRIIYSEVEMSSKSYQSIIYIYNFSYLHSTTSLLSQPVSVRHCSLDQHYSSFLVPRVAHRCVCAPKHQSPRTVLSAPRRTDPLRTVS